MSLIGSKPVNVPASVTITIDQKEVIVKGAKGQLSAPIPSGIKVTLEDNQLIVKRLNESLQSKANHGLCRSLIQNMVTGTSEGFVKKLEMIGTGYRAKMQGQDLVVSAGFSHPIVVPAPQGITLSTETETIIVVSGIDKHQVGEISAKIRSIRKPEPYKGKGIRYQGEVIRRKAGKATKAGA
jgi:large subunit ribosomal protein L6